MDMDSECFNQDELLMLSPTSIHIANDLSRLSPARQIEAFQEILSSIFFEHGINNPLDTLQFMFGQGIEDEDQVTNDWGRVKQAA